MNTQGDELKVELPPAEVTIPEYKKKEHLTRMLVSCPDYKPGTSIMDSNGTVSVGANSLVATVTNQAYFVGNIVALKPASEAPAAVKRRALIIISLAPLKAEHFSVAKTV